MRLIEEDGQVISPFEFLEVAKRTRLYHQITTRVIKKAFMALNQIHRPISINLTVDDILNDETRTYLIHMLKDSEHSSNLIIELVESDGIENFEPIKAFIDEVKSFGVRIAIDDFGTGYSNFEYLFKLDADFIKIDGSLIRNIDQDDNHFKVVQTIVNFAHKAHFKVIAEFVANEAIQQRILQLGIEFSQGYYICPPKFIDEILEITT